jgi:DnaJ domain
VITRDWATVDFYAVLGVEPDADADAIAETFRSLAKRMHPDVAGDMGPVAERFKEVTAAYEVLRNPRRRRAYDRDRQLLLSSPGVERLDVPAPSPTTLSGRVVRRPSEPWTRRRVAVVIAAGCSSMLLGFAFALLIVVLTAREADDRARRIPVAGTAVVGAPELRLVYLAPGSDRPFVAAIDEDATMRVLPGDMVPVRYVAFDPTDVAYRTPFSARFDAATEALVVTTDAGANVVYALDDRLHVATDPTSARGAGLTDGAAVSLFVLPDDPLDVVLAEEHGARNVAFWIVAVKLVVAGPLLVWFARVRRPRVGPTSSITR